MTCLRYNGTKRWPLSAWLSRCINRACLMIAWLEFLLLLFLSARHASLCVLRVIDQTYGYYWIVISSLFVSESVNPLIIYAPEQLLQKLLAFLRPKFGSCQYGMHIVYIFTHNISRSKVRLPIVAYLYCDSILKLHGIFVQEMRDFVEMAWLNWFIQ